MTRQTCAVVGESQRQGGTFSFLVKHQRRKQKSTMIRQACAVVGESQSQGSTERYIDVKLEIRKEREGRYLHKRLPFFISLRFLFSANYMYVCTYTYAVIDVLSAYIKELCRKEKSDTIYIYI